jgi:starch synthase
MKDKRILYVSSEVIPYLPETEISSMSFEAPRMVNKQGGQIRIFMPRYVTSMNAVINFMR